MDNFQNQPLPPGVGTWPLTCSNQPSQILPVPHPYPPPPFNIRPNNDNNHNTASLFPAAQPSMPFPPTQSTTSGTTTGTGIGSQGNGQSDLKGSQTAAEVIDHNLDGTYANDHSSCRLNDGGAQYIESAVQKAVFHEQDVETQQVIQNQRQAKTPSEPAKYSEDILSSRRDPNALKEHLLKMTADHRAEMANKRGKSLHPDNGNMEIGNGYGVPGGGAYYAASLPSVQTTDKAKGSKDLPEFLKQRLKARGILKDEAANNSIVTTENASSISLTSSSVTNTFVFMNGRLEIEHW